MFARWHILSIHETPCTNSCKNESALACKLKSLMHNTNEVYPILSLKYHLSNCLKLSSYYVKKNDGRMKKIEWQYRFSQIPLLIVGVWTPTMVSQGK